MEIEIISIDGCGVQIKTELREHYVRKELIAEIFIKYGGSFTNSIGLALYKADTYNTVKLLTAFREMTKEFLEKFVNQKDIDTSDQWKKAMSNDKFTL